MDAQLAMIVSLAIYKLASLSTGILLAYMGYRLFMAGIWGKAGDVDLQFKQNRLLIKKAAPGTFFTVAGAIVIAFSLYKGLDYRTDEQSPNIERSSEKPSLPDLQTPARK